MANRRDVLLRIRSEGIEETKAGVRTMRDELREFGRTEATARIDVQKAAAEAKLVQLQQRLERLSRQEATPAVKIATARVVEQIDRLELKLDRLDHKRVTVDVDVKRGALERTAAGLGTVERAVGGISSGISDAVRGIPILGNVLGSVLDGAAQLASNLGEALGGLVTSGLRSLTGGVGGLSALAPALGSAVGVAAGLAAQLVALGAIGAVVVVALNAIVQAAIALAGALVALVASAAAAAAGLGAVAIAFGALLLPIVVVGIGLFQRFSAILKAHQAQQQQLAQATQQQKTSEQQLSAALDARKQAEQQLADATVAGRKAMAQAAQDEIDAELGLRNARNGVQDARLNLALARRDLREFLSQAGAAGPQLANLVKRFSNVDFNPANAKSVFGQTTGGSVNQLDLRQKIQAVRDAQLGVANATNQVTHAETTLSDARKKEADFTRRGLAAYKPYTQALHAVAQADKRVAEAEQSTSAAHRKYEQALKGLSDTEQGTLSRVNALIDGFKNLAKAFTDPIFKAANDVFDQLKGRAGFLKDALTQVGQAMGGALRAFGQFLGEPATISAFKTMAQGAVGLVRELGAKAFPDFLRIMREIATTAMPAVASAAHSVSNWLARIAGQPGKIRGAVHLVVGQFQIWARLVGAIGSFLLSVLPAAARAGGQLAGWLTRIVKNWTKWVHEHPTAVAEFFRKAVKRTEEILSWLVKAGIYLATHLPSAAKKARDALGVLATIASGIYHTFKVLTDLLKGDFLQALKDAGKIGILGNPAATDPGNPTTDPGGGGNIWDRFKHALLHRQSGGIVPGVGRGDRVPALLEPGEYVLRRSVVQALSLPVVHALNGGLVPNVQPVAAAGGDSIINNFNITTIDPDPRHYAEKLARYSKRAQGRDMQRRGLG